MGKGDVRAGGGEKENIPTPHELVEWMRGFLPVKEEFGDVIIKTGTKKPDVNIWQALVRVYNDHKSSQATEESISKTRERLAGVLRFIEARPEAID